MKSIKDAIGEQPELDPYTAQIDLEAVGERYVLAARRKDAIARWDAYCPPDMRESDWNHEKMRPWRGQIDRILGWQNDSKGILASGPTGRGKTRAMWALVRRLACEDGVDVRYWHAAEWFSTLQQQVRFGRDEAQGWVEAVARRPIVFIDDLGQEAVQLNREEWAQGWLFRFLDIRLGARLPLLVTTNLTADAMAGRSGAIRGDPLVRRLLDLCQPIPFETAEERSGRRAA